MAVVGELLETNAVISEVGLVITLGLSSVVTFDAAGVVGLTPGASETGLLSVGRFACTAVNGVWTGAAELYAAARSPLRPAAQARPPAAARAGAPAPESAPGHRLKEAGEVPAAQSAVPGDERTVRGCGIQSRFARYERD